MDKDFEFERRLWDNGVKVTTPLKVTMVVPKKIEEHMTRIGGDGYLGKVVYGFEEHFGRARFYREASYNSEVNSLKSVAFSISQGTWSLEIKPGYRPGVVIPKTGLTSFTNTFSTDSLGCYDPNMHFAMDAYTVHLP